MTYTFESMTVEQRQAVIDIFNNFIMNGFAAYPEEPLGYALFDRFL